MPLPQAIADALSSTFTNEEYPLGTLYTQTDAEVSSGLSGVDTALDFALLKGERTWVFVKAAEVIAAGQLCELDVGAPYQVEPNQVNTMDRYLLGGVADNAIPANSYGWIIKQGACVMKTAALTAAFAAVDADGGTAEGQVAATAGAAGTIGYTFEAADATKTGYAQGYIGLP